VQTANERREEIRNYLSDVRFTTLQNVALFGRTAKEWSYSKSREIGSFCIQFLGEGWRYGG
jgi:hypothetical protein